MANLIPPQAKKNIKIEYWVRVVSVWLLLWGMAALLFAVLNVPLYILIQNQLQTYKAQFEDANAQSTSFEKIESEIVLANNTAVLLAAAKNIEPAVPYIELVNSIASDSIVLNSYQLVRNGNSVDKIQISGVATDRESLVAFSNELESVTEFKSAEIPLSNLAKDKNIPFTVSVMINSPASQS